MKAESGKSLSIWAANFAMPKFESLVKEISADVCIIGAGITGLTTAYLLSKEKKKVVVIDDGSVGGGETGRTTAHITSVIDDRYYEIERLHGEVAAKLAADSQIEAINRIEKIVHDENIYCDFKRVNGYLLFEPDDPSDLLEYDAVIKAGLDAEICNSPLDYFKYFRCLRFSNQAQFHPLKYLSALAKSIVGNGGAIYTNTFANQIEDYDSGAVVNTKNGCKITTADVVIATNSPISDYLAVHPKQSAYRTYVIAAKLKKNTIEEGLFWDNEDPYHYIRLHSQNGETFILIGGEDHKTGQDEFPEMRFINLEKWARARIENLGDVKFKWSGQVMEPADGLSFIGKDPENSNHVYIATGDSGMGITHGTFAAMINTDLIMDRHNKWAELYDPKRKTMKAAPEFLKEGTNFISQYIDLVTPGEVKNTDEIVKGEGNVLREGLEKVAVYKDYDGLVYKFSAYCPHLKCILHWNSAEKSWDCPCHGSRFDAYGKVLNGPAITDMEVIEFPKTKPIAS